jgi:hypothetical protein
VARVLCWAGLRVQHGWRSWCPWFADATHIDRRAIQRDHQCSRDDCTGDARSPRSTTHVATCVRERSSSLFRMCRTVRVDGPLGDHQHLGDLTIRLASSNQDRHLALASTPSVHVAVDWRRRRPSMLSARLVERQLITTWRSSRHRMQLSSPVQPWTTNHEPVPLAAPRNGPKMQELLSYPAEELRRVVGVDRRRCARVSVAQHVLDFGQAGTAVQQRGRLQMAEIARGCYIPNTSAGLDLALVVNRIPNARTAPLLHIVQQTATRGERIARSPRRARRLVGCLSRPGMLSSTKPHGLWSYKSRTCSSPAILSRSASSITTSSV